MENKKSFLKGALCGALAMLCLALVGGVGYYGMTKIVLKKDPTKGLLEKIGNSTVVDESVETKLELLQAFVKTKFLNQDDISKQAMLDGIYRGYIEGLGDPYSTYYNEEETNELYASTAGEFGGIGVGVIKDKETGFLTLLNLQEDSPAEQAGVLENDILTEVEGQSTTGKEVEEVVSEIRGEVGTKVTITVIHSETGKEQELTITRATIKDETVVYELKEDKIGYIYVKQFDTVTLEQFDQAIDELTKQGMKGYVVDLRNNGGGNLDTVCEMLDLLLPEGTIVSVKDKAGEETVYSSEKNQKVSLPMAVLVNGYSASASEIFAGAVQDYELGDIIGETTYGKGVVQNIYDLKDGTSVKLTMAEYFTPDGRNIHGEGIKPDVEVVYEHNEDNIEQDNQLEAALANLKEIIYKK